MMTREQGRRIEHKLDALLEAEKETHRLLRLIVKGEEIIMSQYDDLVAALNSETNDIASRIDSLVAAVNAGQNPDLSALQALSDRLKALGSDPNKPIPAPVDPNAPQAKRA